jgi:hypothetical protein
LKRGCEQNFDPEVEPATKKQIPFGNENKKGKSKDQVSSFPPATKGDVQSQDILYRVSRDILYTPRGE